MTAPGDRPLAATGGVSVAEAAARLGVTTDTVRRRLHRGTLAGDKTEEGQWRVWLPEPVLEVEIDIVPGDRQDIARLVPGSPTMPPGRSPADTELIETLQAAVTDLRTRLDAESEARRRADHIILELSQRPVALPTGVSDTETTLDATVAREREPTPHERREAFWHAPAGAPTTLRALIRRLVGR